MYYVFFFIVFSLSLCPLRPSFNLFSLIKTPLSLSHLFLRSSLTPSATLVFPSTSPALPTPCPPLALPIRYPLIFPLPSVPLTHRLPLPTPTSSPSYPLPSPFSLPISSTTSSPPLPHPLPALNRIWSRHGRRLGLLVHLVCSAFLLRHNRTFYRLDPT